MNSSQQIEQALGNAIEHSLSAALASVIDADCPPKLAEAMRTTYAHRVEPPRALPAGECYVETECPRGQMGFYVVGRPGKEAVPLRVRARSSCLAYLSVVGELCRGCLVGDVPAIVGSLDIVMGEIDR